MSSVDVEEVALRVGLKPNIRMSVPREEAHLPAARFRARGLVVLEAPSPEWLFEDRRALLYISTSEAKARELRDLEACAFETHQEPARREVHEGIGRLLGYPPCCVAAFSARLVPVHRAGSRTERAEGQPPAEDFVAARAAWVAHPDPRLNVLLLEYGVRLVTFYPCRFDCPAAGAYASELLAALTKLSRPNAGAIAAGLLQSVVLLPSGARAVVDLDANGLVTNARALEVRRSGRRERDRRLAAALVGRRATENGSVDLGTSVGHRVHEAADARDAASDEAAVLVDFAWAARER